METMEALYLLKNTIIYSQTLCRLLPSTVREQKLQVNVLTFPALPPKLNQEHAHSWNEHPSDHFIIQLSHLLYLQFEWENGE